MKRELIPYYISRGLLSVFMGIVVSGGFNAWQVGVLVGGIVFVGFIYYAHCGHYLVDTSRPLMPLRRDERGMYIRDRASVAGIAVGGAAYALFYALSLILPLPFSAGGMALAVGVLAYFVVTTRMYAKK
jgi:hypothetical protein